MIKKIISYFIIMSMLVSLCTPGYAIDSDIIDYAEEIVVDNINNEYYEEVEDINKEESSVVQEDIENNTVDNEDDIKDNINKPEEEVEQEIIEETQEESEKQLDEEDTKTEEIVESDEVITDDTKEAEDEEIEDSQETDEIQKDTDEIEEESNNTEEAKEETEEDSVAKFEIKREVIESPYICFDLSAGKVNITSSSYSGYIWVDGIATNVTGEHTSDNEYYVFQTNNGEFIEADEYGIPIWDRVEHGSTDWGEYITNNKNISTIISNWNSDAMDVGRKSTANYITVTGNGNYNITIDNIWTTYNPSETSRKVGGIGYDNTAGGVLTVYLKGDNRVGNIHYNCATSNGKLIFEDGEDGSTPGTITCASYDGKSNHYNSVIGGNDAGKEASYGITINSGIIYAGSQTGDNCSAIGAGGNGYGKIYINGGIVTAVANSSGAAIGGGIGESDQGGNAYIEITGGEVYAYNFGYVSSMSGSKYFIAGAGIGGGSSCKAAGNASTTVNISGGYVFASSLGGAAIGGGSSTMSSGGPATVNISGDALVEAQSISGTDTSGKQVLAGTSIGGGTAGAAGSANGGSITLNITGGTIYTGSIGGGGCNNTTGQIGSGTVLMTDGEMHGQIVMGRGAGTNTFTMLGGIIDNHMQPVADSDHPYTFIEEFGGAVHLEYGNVLIDGGTIKNTESERGGAVYINGGSFIMDSGRLYNSTSEHGGVAYINSGNLTINGGYIYDCSAVYGGAISINDGNFTMNGGSIEDCISSIDGGAVYVSNGDITINDGEISSNKAGYGGAVFTKGGNVVINHGIINDNEAIQGGAIYISGTIETYLKMRSGEMSNNKADDDGGAIYITSGNLLIGIQDCLGVDGENDDHILNNLGKHHPHIHNNKAGDCGGGVCIVNEGEVHFYCGTAVGNEALYKGVGKNIFMDGGEFYFYDGTNVGIPRDPDLVIIGGELHNECTNVEMIKIRYSRSNEEADGETLEGLAELNEYINLPDAEYFWEGREGYRFVGWTAYGYNSSTETKVVRDKGDYKPSGMSIQISDTAAIGGKQNTFDGTEDEVINLYALWAPSVNHITYMDSLRFGVKVSDSIGNTTPNTYQVKETDYTITIKPAEVDMIAPGFEVVGWWIYQDQAVNGNWCELDSNGEYKAYEPAYKTKTKADTNLNLARDGSGMKYYKLASPNSDLKLIVSELTFGDIVLIADYQLSYGELEIESGQLADVDQHQGIIYNIKSKKFDAVENSTGIVNTEILAEIDKLSQIELNISSLGETKVIKGLPTGTYTVDCNTDWNWRYTTTDKEVYVGKNSQIAYSFIRKIKQWIDFNTLYTDIL